MTRVDELKAMGGHPVRLDVAIATLGSTIAEHLLNGNAVTADNVARMYIERDKALAERESAGNASVWGERHGEWIYLVYSI